MAAKTNKVQHYRTAVAGRIPSAANMQIGEIAINTTDQILYTKAADGSIVRVGVGGYTKAEMDARFLPQGILPITRVGDLTATALPIYISGTNAVVSAPIPVILSGRQFSIAAAPYPFTLSSATGTLYMYVTIQSSTAVLECSMTAVAESFTRVLIGAAPVSGGLIGSASTSKVSRLDIYRPSLNPMGSAFPVSSGTPDTSGNINW